MVTLIYCGTNMNERIRELAKQALKQPDTDNDGLTVFDNDELEKFAELIVRECLSKIENEAAQYHEPVWSIELVNDIKDHFGV
jgi:hypothetical protein